MFNIFEVRIASSQILQGMKFAKQVGIVLANNVCIVELWSSQKAIYTDYTY